MTERIEKLKSAAEKEIGGKVQHVESTPVIETFRGDVAWDGIVETFDVSLHPQVKRCYALMYIEDNGEARCAVVREGPEVNSPQLAVRQFIASRVER